MTEQNYIPPSSPLQGANKLLFSTLAVFVLIIIGLSSYIYFVKKAPSTSSPPTTQIGQISPPDLPDPFDINSEQKSFNQLAYDYTKAQFSGKTPYTSEGRFHGKLLQIDQANNTLTLKLESLEKNTLGKMVWYVYDQSTLPKVTVYEGEGFTKTITLADLQAQNEVFIDEKIDYSKSYPEGIVSVKITKL